MASKKKDTDLTLSQMASNYAVEKGVTKAEASEALQRIGYGRWSALQRFTTGKPATPKKARAAKPAGAKKASKKAGTKKKSKSAPELPAAEGSPTLHDEPVGATETETAEQPGERFVAPEGGMDDDFD